MVYSFAEAKEDKALIKLPELLPLEFVTNNAYTCC
jgi:hypothetical protein